MIWQNKGEKHMKVLFIGGTGTISTAITKELLEQKHEVYLINRGTRKELFQEYANITYITLDIHNEEDVKKAINHLSFDVVADFIAFTPLQVERDYRIFQGKTKQFIFISSASAYQKPLSDYRITEGTPLANPYWEYSQNKIACENFLMKQYRENGFPVTIIRPSHTYDERRVPLGVHGRNGSWQVIKRMMEGKKVIIHGDGTSLWTMTHNSDFAKAFVGIMGNLHAIGESVQITSDETLNWNQIYGAIANALGKELKAIHISSEILSKCSNFDLEGSLIGDKANSIVFDNAKLKRLVPGFTATKRFDEGIRETIEYILAHKELQEEDKEFDEWCDRMVYATEKMILEINKK